MALPEFTIRQLLEAGVHFGHRKHLWNPKMSSYIYGTRNNIHIIDLSQTAPLLHAALKSISNTVAKGGRVLMVGTKRQAHEGIAEAARQSAQYFVNSRWLGGTLTNWKTVSLAIDRLRELDEVLQGDTTGRTKKEILNMTRERDKLERNLGGIKDMGGVPDMLFVIDSNREAIAIQEAKRLGIPVAAVLDSNSNPVGITYPIPGNDDASRSVNLYCELVSQAAIDGLSRAQVKTTVDSGENEEPALESLSSESDSKVTDDSGKKGTKTKKVKLEKKSKSKSATKSKVDDNKTTPDKITKDKASTATKEKKTPASGRSKPKDGGETDKKVAKKSVTPKSTSASRKSSSDTQKKVEKSTQSKAEEAESNSKSKDSAQKSTGKKKSTESKAKTKPATKAKKQTGKTTVKDQNQANTKDLDKDK